MQFLFVYKTTSNETIHTRIEGVQAFLDSCSILDQKHAHYDVYVVSENDNQAEVEMDDREHTPFFL